MAKVPSSSSQKRRTFEGRCCPVLGCRTLVCCAISTRTANSPPVSKHHLSEQHILSFRHRDIKPDNILLDSEGHAHLTDFNVAIHYSDKRMHTSVAGSIAYMAPEVIGRRGYSWQIDWWSLGITAYELLFNKRPFEGRTSEKMQHAILNDALNFPDNASDRCSSACLSALQGVRITSRPGCRSLIIYLVPRP